MDKDVYVIGDESRLVVKNFLQGLRATGCDFKILGPDAGAVPSLPEKAIHLIVCLEEKISFQILRDIADLQKRTGLSLYLVGSMGNISLEDEEFFKHLPCVRFASYTVEIEKLTKVMERNDCDKKRILVVDDEPILLRSIKLWLGDDFKVFLVDSGELALRFLSLHPVDLVLLDYKMPTMDGPEVLRQIRSDSKLKDLPVMFLTANNNKDSIIAVINLKPNGYILKNKEPEAIKKTIENFFNSQQFVPA